MNLLIRVTFTASRHKTFRHILRSTVSSNFNIMIRGFATADGNSESEQVVEQMMIRRGEGLSRAVVEVLDRTRREKGLSPNETTYTSLIDSLCKQDRIDDAYRVLNEVFLSGLFPSVGSDTLNDVLHGFLRIGDMRNAFEMRIKMNAHTDELWIDDDTESSLYQGLSIEVTYTSLINAYLDEGNWDYAEQLYDEMKRLDKRLDRNEIPHFSHICPLPDSVKYSVFINGFDNKARTTQIKKKLLRFNYEKSLSRPILEYHRTLAENSSDHEFKSVVELVESICIKGLENVFDIILKSNYKPDGIDDGILYNLFIIAHCKHFNVDEAYIMYKEMVHYGFACHMFTVFALMRTLCREDMGNELRWVIQNILTSCNLNDYKILKFLDKFEPAEHDSEEALFNVLAEKAKDGLFLQCSYAPPSA